jgi:uncharacterized protein (TIGR03382 family)
MKMHLLILPMLGAVLWTCPAALADLVSYTETFTAGAANWRAGDTVTTLTHLPDGGPAGAGDAYASATVSFAALADDDSPVVARGHDAYDSSGDAFVGDWLMTDATVVSFTVMVRHNVPSPVAMGVRLAMPANFPAATAVAFAPVLPNVWTELSFAISPGNPQLVSFEGSDFETVFSSIGNVQMFATVPAGLGGSGTAYTFDIDNPGVQVIPEPGTASLCAGALALLATLRRRRTHPPRS